MKALLIAAAMAFSTPALAEEPSELGEAMFEQVDAADACLKGGDTCQRALELALLISENGYCFDKEARDWVKCHPE